MSRFDPIPEGEWREWLKKGERDQLLSKCKEDNRNIEISIKKMFKKIEAKQLPGRVLSQANLSRNGL